MRTIKFRVWDVGDRKMIEWNRLKFIWNLRETFEEDVERYPYMQFTGLYDKNGKEIYEGDICETVSASGNPFGTIDLVSFSEGGFIFKDPEDKLLPIPINDTEIISIEVIGNRWEHPELLGDN